MGEKAAVCGICGNPYCFTEKLLFQNFVLKN